MPHKMIDDFTALTVVAAADLFVVEDTSASETKKITPEGVLSAINILTAETTVDGAADFVPVWDTSAGAVRKVLLDNLPVGNHAASKITSGTLAHERGGLEADVSAYSGLVKITGGVTSAVTVTAFAESILDDADAATVRTTIGAAAAADVTALTSGYSRRKSVINRVDNTAAPPTEVSGDRYLLDATGTSHANWDGALINQIVEFNGTTWDATAPSEGWIVYNDNSDTDWLYVDDGSPAWQERTAGGASDHGALSGLTDDDHTQYLLAAGTRAGTGLQEFLGLNLTDSTELTISSGAVTVTQGYHTIDTEGDASSDDLDTITVAGGEGDVLILRAESSARTVVLKHGTGNIQCAEGYDLSLDSDYDYAILIRKDGTNWMAFSGARRMPPYLDNGDTLGGANAGDIYYHDGTTVTNLRNGTNGQVLTLAAGLPSWAAASGSGAGFGFSPAMDTASEYSTPHLAGTLTTRSITAGNLYAYPVWIPFGESIDFLAIENTTTAAGNNLRVGLYEDDNGRPGDLVLESGELSLTAASYKTASPTAVSVSRGWYWLAVLSQATVTVRSIDQGNVTAFVGVGWSGGTSDTTGVGFYIAQTYGAMPDPFPAGNLFDDSGDVPYMQCK